MNFFVYILKSLKDEKLYIGQTNNLENRIKRHNAGQVHSTKNRRPLEILHTEKFDTRKEAMLREKYLKSLKSSQYILENIINSTSYGKE
ncbi:MAG: GIY-YIG nuclease family protein [Parcubacteria group bacterium]|jgi:putative endonuclease